MPLYHLQIETTTGPRFLMGHPNSSKLLAAADEIIEAMRRGERPDTSAVRVLCKTPSGKFATLWEHVLPKDGPGSAPLLDYIARNARA